MINQIRILACAAACVLAAGLSVRAADRPEGPMRGHVLVLENDRVLEGDIEHTSEGYVIRRASGETVLPPDHVLRLCADMGDAYLFLRSRANLNDADELLRLARWCQAQGLSQQAVRCATEAADLRPQDESIRRLLGYLKRAADPKPPATTTPPELATVAVPELCTESLSGFANKVQPILLNVCASCHMGDRGGSFRLLRGTEATTSPKRATQHNLAQVLAQVNLQQPQSSPLLVKAVTAHGEALEAPLKGKQIAAYHTLEEWVNMTVAKNPHLRESSTPPPDVKTTSLPSTPPTKPANTPLVKPEGETTASSGFAADRAAHATETTPDRPNEVKPQKPVASSDDAYDPGPFNREAHPERTRETPRK
jgi:hypothetical protein